MDGPCAGRKRGTQISGRSLRCEHTTEHVHKGDVLYVIEKLISR